MVKDLADLRKPSAGLVALQKYPLKWSEDARRDEIRELIEDASPLCLITLYPLRTLFHWVTSSLPNRSGAIHFISDAEGP